jgi:hypothetical protein
MKNMTKRDVADIVLAVVGFLFVLRFLQSLVYIGAIFSTPNDEYFNRFLIFQLYLINLLVLFIVSYLLLSKRDKIIELLFPDADMLTLKMDKEFVDCSKYIFWIKLVGIIQFLFSGTKFVANIVSAVPVKSEWVSSFFWWFKVGPEFVSAIIAIIVIWKAEWIAKFIEEIGHPGKPKKEK